MVRRNGVYYFRARVPKDLVRAFQKREVKKSLGTSDRSEALKAVRLQSVKFDTDVEAIRRMMDENIDDRRSLTEMRDDEIERIVIRWFAEQERDDKRRSLARCPR